MGKKRISGAQRVVDYFREVGQEEGEAVLTIARGIFEQRFEQRVTKKAKPKTAPTKTGPPVVALPGTPFVTEVKS